LFSQALSYLGVYCREYDVQTLGVKTVAKLLVGRELSALSSLLHRLHVQQALLRIDCASTYACAGTAAA